MKKVMKKTVAATLAVIFLAAGQGVAATLEEERDSYDAQVEELGRKSDELAGKIDSLSEQKRLLDEEASAAIAEHKARRFWTALALNFKIPSAMSRGSPQNFMRRFCGRLRRSRHKLSWRLHTNRLGLEF